MNHTVDREYAVAVAVVKLQELYSETRNIRGIFQTS